MEDCARVTLYGDRQSHVFLQSDDTSLCYLRPRWLLFFFSELQILCSVKPWKTTCWVSIIFFRVNNMKSLHCLKCRGKSVRSLFVFYMLNKLFFCVKDLADSIVPWVLSWHSICREETTGFVVWFNTKVQVVHIPDIHRHRGCLKDKCVSCLYWFSLFFIFFFLTG